MDDNDRLCAGTLPADPFEDAVEIGSPIAWRSIDESTLAVREQKLDPLSSWPEPPADECFHGLAGDFVRLVEPHTESDPIALLIQFLVATGCSVGHGPHFLVEDTEHTLNEFAVLVGVTSKGRKGTSWGRVRRIFSIADPDWERKRIPSGLSSGEGLIWKVRDPIERTNSDGELEIVDQGEKDKRLLVFEGEFASTLRVLQREGNTLSPQIRSAWDTGDMQSLTKNSPAQATGAHIAILGHITKDEALRYLDRTEMANGLGNRFLWACVRRSKCLPEGGSLSADALERIAQGVQKVLSYSRDVNRITMDEDSRKLWRKVYPRLSEGSTGMLGAMTGRAEAHVLRLASIYSILDSWCQIRLEHLRAALALWAYCAASARFVFGSTIGEPISDRILEGLDAAPSGLTRTEIRGLFAGHRTESQIEQGLAVLRTKGLAVCQVESTGGRPVERWRRGIDAR